MNVTTTSLRQGKFETRFWHKVFEEEVGRVKGHFGPINTYVMLLSALSQHLENSHISPALLFTQQVRAMHLEERTVSCACIISTTRISRLSLTET